MLLPDLHKMETKQSEISFFHASSLHQVSPADFAVKQPGWSGQIPSCKSPSTFMSLSSWPKSCNLDHFILSFCSKKPSIQIVYSAGSLDELGPSCIYFTRGFFGEAAASISKAMSGVSIPEPFKSQTPEDQQIKLLRCFENSLKRWSKWQSDA